MTREMAINILRGAVLGTNEQTHEAVFMAIKALKEQPTVDPVKHGEWRYDEALELEWCSECGFGKRKGDKRWYSYCPNCGCKMEVEEDGFCSYGERREDGKRDNS